MKAQAAVLMLLVTTVPAAAQTRGSDAEAGRYPAETWLRYATPEEGTSAASCSVRRAGRRSWSRWV